MVLLSNHCCNLLNFDHLMVKLLLECKRQVEASTSSLVASCYLKITNQSHLSGSATNSAAHNKTVLGSNPSPFIYQTVRAELHLQKL